MRARRRKRSDDLATHNYHRNAHMREPALARKEPPFAPPSRSLVTFLSRLSVVFSGLLDHLIRSQQESLRNRQTERLGCFEVDDQLELGGLLDRQITGASAAKDLVDERRRLPELRWQVRPVRNQAAALDVIPEGKHHGQAVPRR